MVGYSAKEAAERMGVNLKSFFRVIGSLMLQNGDAVLVGGRYVVLADRLDKWVHYAQERDRRAAIGEWGYSRAWSLDDLRTVMRERAAAQQR